MDSIEDVHRVVAFLSLLVGGIGLGLLFAVALMVS